MEPAIFFAGQPNLDELCGITVSVTMADGLCVMQPHIIRCREIIFTEQDVIASPSLDMDASFSIVLQKSLLKTGRLQARLQKQGMQMTKPSRVHPGLYQACLTYTMVARMSPGWNKASDWMLQGRDFLSHEGYTNAVKMSLRVNREEIYISLAGTAVRFPPLQVEDLTLSRSEMQAILRSTEGVPCPVEVNNAWCHVLPSMKRGKISSLALTIPKESPFPSYKELKRHWKNMYGYRLPDTDEDILYCQIGFLASGGGRQFTYPSVCLRASPPQVVQRFDPKPVLTAFLQELHAKAGRVCGAPLRFQPRLRYAAPILNISSQPPARVNLSTKPVHKPTGPLRDSRSMSNLYHASGLRSSASLTDRLQGPQGCAERATESTPGTSQEQSTAGLDGEKSELLSHSKGKPQRPGCIGDLKEKPTMPGAENSNSLQDSVSVDARTGSSSSQAQSQLHDSGSSTSKKLVPLFRPKIKPANFQRTVGTVILNGRNKESDLSSGRFVPVFKSQRSQGPCGASISRQTNGMKPITKTNCINKTPMLSNKSVLSDFGTAPSTPNSQPVKLFTLGDNDNESYTLDEPKDTEAQLPPPIAPVFSQRFKPQTPQFGSKIIKPRPQTPKGAPKTAKPRTPAASGKQKDAGTPLLQHTPSRHVLQSPTGSWGGRENNMMLMTPPTNKFQSLDDDDFEYLVGTATPCGAKRTNATEQVSTPAKKSRAKPQVQNVDVEALARANQLSKVNTATLIAWLRERGGVCRARDKKSDLMERVNVFLNIAAPEQ